MFNAIAIATAMGTVSYLWMTASALPVTRGFRATCRTGRDGWLFALPLAIGASAIVAFGLLDSSTQPAAMAQSPGDEPIAQSSKVVVASGN